MENAEKLSVTVTPAMASMIREKVEDGSYGTASEVIRAALRALQRDDEEHAERMASIRARIKASIEDDKPPVPLDEAIVRVKAHLRNLASTTDDPAPRRRPE